MSESGYEFELGLSDPQRAGVFFVEAGDLAAIAMAARDTGLRVLRIDLEGCRDKATLLLRLAVTLDFPPGFGRNWDALSDALRDLSWLPARGYALLFNDAAQLRDTHEADFDTLLDILDEARAQWAETGIPFWSFLALPASDFDDAGHSLN